jgi:hypothetical protein
MSPSSIISTLSKTALIEQGKLALQSIEYQEQAARYHAEAAKLKAALLNAEQGDDAVLREWFVSRNQRLDGASYIAKNSEPESCELTDTSVSFWSTMESAALVRIEARQKKQKKEIVESTAVVQEIKSLELERPITLDWSLGPPSSETLERPQLRSLLASAPFWASLLVHVAIVAVLGVVVIRAAKKAEKLAIVSSPVEAENVLTETAMEMTAPSLDTSLSEPMQMEPMLSPSDLIADIPTAVLGDVGTMPSERTASSGKPSDSIAASLSSYALSKMAAGAEFFGVKATGNVFVYVVDSSPSMRRDGAFEAAKAEMIRSLSSMKPKQRFFISFFGKEVEPMVFDPKTIERFPIPAVPENIKKTLDWLNRISIQKEGWPPNDALREAIRMQPDGIFLLFDGDTKVDVAKFLRQENRTEDILSGSGPKVPIHVIHFFSDEFEKPMRLVAQENGGTYRFVPRPQRNKTSKN